jgi:hypothetical protein
VVGAVATVLVHAVIVIVAIAIAAKIIFFITVFFICFKFTTVFLIFQTI